MRSRASILSLLLIAALLVVVGGCDKAKQAWFSVVGDDEAEADTEGDVERQLELEREQAELARLEGERLERQRVAAEALRRELEQADTLVEQWAERLAASKSDHNAFAQHQGLTEDDPWARQLRIQYTSADDEQSQTLEVRSAGPNGRFDDDDDLLRTRTTQLERSWWARNKVWAIGAFVWIGLGFISAGGVQRRTRRKKGTQDESLDAADILISLLYIVFAPLTMLFWVGVTVIEVVGDILD